MPLPKPLLSPTMAGKHTAYKENLMHINKSFIIDKKGNPKAVIVSIKDFQKIEELLGLDLDSSAQKDLKEAREDREQGCRKAYIDLDSI